jgi:hypothetical protein
MMQLGAAWASGDVRYGTWRRGFGVDSNRCPVPDGHIRSQAGPFYYFNARNPELLADWGASYKNMRPRRNIRRSGVQSAEKIISNRMAAISTKPVSDCAIR